MSIDQSNINDVLDKDVHGSDGEKIGAVGNVFLDDVTGTPEWVTVKTGLFGTKETFVPIGQGQLDAEGVTVPYTKDLVKDAPNIEADTGHLSQDQEAELYRHYSLDAPDTTTLSGTQDERRDGERGVDVQPGQNTGQAPLTGHDPSGRSAEESMTRSEERLNVGTRTEQTGRARLRKYVVTEQESVTVPVTKERAVLEREPITEGTGDRTRAGADLSEEDHEVVLHEERPVVEKETVAAERVALGTERTTEDVQVTEEVRKEQIETDGIDEPTGR